MRTAPKSPTTVQLTATAHGLAARTDHGRVILMQMHGNEVSWIDVTPQWKEDGSLDYSPVAKL